MSALSDTLEFVVSLQVEGYFPDAEAQAEMSHDDCVEFAFEDCRESLDDAAAQGREVITEAVGPERSGECDLWVEFQEFDSHNWTHASGNFLAWVRGPSELVARVREHLAQ